MTSTNSNGWNGRASVQKGFIGERIVSEFLNSKGYVIYAPATEGAHPFDRICASADKRHIFIAEIKSKAARTFYPDSGINIRNYEDYKHIQQEHNLSVLVLFVDERSKTIYGNFLDELETKRVVASRRGQAIHYPLIEKQIIFFPLASMVTIGKISTEDVAALKELSRRKSDYE